MISSVSEIFALNVSYFALSRSSYITEELSVLGGLKSLDISSNPMRFANNRVFLLEAMFKGAKM